MITYNRGQKAPRSGLMRWLRRDMSKLTNRCSTKYRLWRRGWNLKHPTSAD